MPRAEYRVLSVGAVFKRRKSERKVVLAVKSQGMWSVLEIFISMDGSPPIIKLHFTTFTCDLVEVPPVTQSYGRTAMIPPTSKTNNPKGNETRNTADVFRNHSNLPVVLS